MIEFFRSGGGDAMDSLKNLTSLKWKEWIANQRWVLLILLICWLYFSFTKMWVFAAIVASSITV
jgi:hypothetical protein